MVAPNVEGLPLFDPKLGARARDAGMAAVEEPSLADLMEETVDLYPGLCFTGEDLRFLTHFLTGGYEPHHGNCWGAAVMTLIHRKRLKPLNEFRHSRDPRSHSRIARVHRLMPRPPERTA